MKKALIYSLSLALTLSLTACGNQGDTSNLAGTLENNGSLSSGQAETASSGPRENGDTRDKVDVQTGDISTGTVVSGTQDEQTEQTEQTGETGETGQTGQDGEKVEEPFTEVNETIYATGTVNLRSSYSTQSDKVGSMTKGQSATRIGIGTGDADGWSKIQLSDGSIVYVSSKYLSTTKPATSSGNNSKPPQQSKPSGDTSKPPKPSVPSDKGSSSSDQETLSQWEEAMKDFKGSGTVDPNAKKNEDGSYQKQGGV